MSAPLDEGLAADTPSMSWLKSDLLAYAQGRGLEATESMTKPEILAAIEAA